MHRRSFSLRQCLDGVSSLLPSDGKIGMVEEWNTSTTEDNQNTIFKCSTAPSFPFFNLSLWPLFLFPQPLHRHRKVKRRAPVGIVLRPKTSPVCLDDGAADGQSHAEA